MQSVVDRNVVMRRLYVLQTFLMKKNIVCLTIKHSGVYRNSIIAVFHAAFRYYCGSILKLYPLCMRLGTRKAVFL